MKRIAGILVFIFFSLTQATATEWLYYKNFPWVFDNKTQDWLYLWGGENGKVYAFSSSSQAWSEFMPDENHETVISDTNGQAVVVKHGDEYSWSNELDGIILWAVEWEPGETPDIATVKFENGNILYGFDAFSTDVADLGNNKVSYSIDENGYLKSLEGDGDYQYYNIASIEDGIIGTIQNDQGVDSVANNGVNQIDQWFFTTKAAAETFYQEKMSPVVVVTDANGQAVVVQSGNEYSWSNELDGIILWAVEWEQGETPDIATVKFENGNILYGFDAFSTDVADLGNNKVSYSIDENGYLKSLEGDGDYQYYNIASIEDGIIGTIQNDQGVDSVANNGVNQIDQWFFTTKVAAETFLNSL